MRKHLIPCPCNYHNGLGEKHRRCIGAASCDKALGQEQDDYETTLIHQAERRGLLRGIRLALEASAHELKISPEHAISHIRTLDTVLLKPEVGGDGQAVTAAKTKRKVRRDG